MYSNRKDKDKVASEMEMFLGDAAVSFTNWLWGEFDRYFSAPSDAAAAAVLLLALDASEPRMLYIDGKQTGYKWDGSNGIKIE